MACYYLVISSTHLSNGHYRSIKGVFRGPLCKSAGGESPDYIEKEERIAKALGDLKANFYCELCDKQYHKHQEFDNHINSYDHAHKQRLKELKQREFARNVSSKSWKDERKQKRAVKRLHQLAQLKQQRDSDDRKVSKLTSTIKDQDHVKISNGSSKFDTKPPASSVQDTSPISTDVPLNGLSSTCALTHQQPCLAKHSSPVKTSGGNQSPRPGVSFCFSRRAQLKLDSCASVFSDGLEEASEYQELQRQRQRLALEALWSCSSSPRTPCNDDHELSHDPSSLGWADGNSQASRIEAQAERWESLKIKENCSTTEAKKLMCPDTHSPGSNTDPAGSEDILVDGGQRPRAEGAYGGSEKSDCPSPTVYTDGQGTMAQSQLKINKDTHQHTEKNTEQGIMQNEKDCVPEKETENIQPTCKDGNKDQSSKAPVFFLKVLSKEGNTVTWPSELVQYTSDEPRVSYSCNPLRLYFKHREGKEKSTKPVEIELRAVERLAGQDDRTEPQKQDVPGHKLAILKPKRPKHKRKGKTRRRKLDAARSRQAACALKTCSQTEAGGRFEFQSAPPDTSLHKQACTERRHKLGKRKRSVRDETSNESDTPEHSLKSIIVSSLSAPARKRKKYQKVRGLMSALRLVKRRPFPYSPPYTTGRGDNYRWFDDAYESKRDAASTPTSDKSGSWCGLSDLTSDGEWPAYHTRRNFASPRSKPWRGEHSQPMSCIRNDSHNIPHYGYRHMSDSPGRDFEHRGDCWNYTDSLIYNKRKYSAVCNSLDQNEGYSIRRHKRFEELKNKEHRTKENGRLFYRVYDSPEPQDDIRDWWYENLSPISRRHREREESSWSSPERSEERWYNKPVSIRSPSSFSSTSISDLSEDWMWNSNIRPSPARQRQEHSHHSTERSVKKKFSRSPHRKRSHSPPLATCNTAAQSNSSQSVVVQGDVTQKSTPESTNQCAVVEKEIKVKKANGTLSLPLIGKFPSIKKGTRKIGIHKDATGSISNRLQTPVPSNPHTALQTDNKDAEQFQHKEQNFKVSKACLQTTNQKRSTETCTALALQPDSSLSPKPGIRDLEDKAETAGIYCAKRITPPLSEQPFTFTEEEIEKYRLLQLQAQQHMQQQHLQEQQEIQETPVDMSHIPVTTPESTTQTTLSACLPYSVLQPSLSSIAPHRSPVNLLPHHPSLTQPHFAPPLPAAFLPAPPATVLAAHPLHLIPASALHPIHPHHHIPGLALRPLPPASLLPTILSPMPMAAAAAASTLQIHPLLHPLFHRQDLQRHPGPTS